MHKNYHEMGWWIASALYCVLIFYLSSRSTLPLPDGFHGQDKWIHATAYAVMAGLFWQAGQFQWNRKPWILACLVVAWCAFYGATDEWHQSFVIGRDASVYDWFADITGAALFCLFRLRYS